MASYPAGLVTQLTGRLHGLAGVRAQTAWPTTLALGIAQCTMLFPHHQQHAKPRQLHQTNGRAPGPTDKRLTRKSGCPTTCPSSSHGLPVCIQSCTPISSAMTSLATHHPRQGAAHPCLAPCPRQSTYMLVFPPRKIVSTPCISTEARRTLVHPGPTTFFPHAVFTRAPYAPSSPRPDPTRLQLVRIIPGPYGPVDLHASPTLQTPTCKTMLQG